MLQRLLDKIRTGCTTCSDCQDLEPASSAGDKGSVSPCFEKLHQREKEELLRLLEQTGQGLSPVEMAIVDEFLAHEGHLSADFIKDRLARRKIDVSEEAVESILDLLCRYGLAQKVQLNGTGPWYEHLHIGENHDHLLCTRCGRVVEFDDEEFKEQVKKPAKKYGFEPLFQKTTIYGICKQCKDAHKSAIPLAMVSVGEKVTITALDGGSKLKQRLTDLGLLIGETVEVLGKTGPVILSVKGSRIAIGKGIAQKILVIPNS